MESAHQLSFRPECNNTAEVPSFTLRTALSAIPFVTDLCGVDVQWSRIILHKTLPNSKELSVWMTLGFLFGSKNFFKLLCVSWKVCVLHGYDWIHWVVKSCTSIAYRWLFRDSQHSLRTLWSALIKSPKFSARNTTLPIRLLHGALVILVHWQISQFRSFGKWVYTLCLLKSALLVGSKDYPWEELACESMCSGTLSSTGFSLNSCSHSGMSEWHGSHRTRSWSSFSFGFGILVGLVNSSSGISEEHGSLRSCLSTRSLDTIAGWWSTPHGSHRSCLSTLSLDTVEDVMDHFPAWEVSWCWRRQAWGRTRW